MKKHSWISTGLCGLLALGGCAVKKNTPTPPDDVVSEKVQKLRQAGLPDDTVVDDAKAPSALNATFTRSENTVTLVWERPSTDANAAFSYEVYRAYLDAKGVADGAASKIFTADNSVLKTVVTFAAPEGKNPVFNVVVRKTGPARDATPQAPLGSMSIARLIIEHPGVAIFGAVCGDNPRQTGAAAAWNVFSADLEAGAAANFRAEAPMGVALQSGSGGDLTGYYNAEKTIRWVGRETFVTQSRDNNPSLPTTAVDQIIGPTGVVIASAAAPDARTVVVRARDAFAGNGDFFALLTNEPSATSADFPCSPSYPARLEVAYTKPDGGIARAELSENGENVLKLFQPGDIRVAWVPGRNGILVVSGGRAIGGCSDTTPPRTLTARAFVVNYSDAAGLTVSVTAVPADVEIPASIPDQALVWPKATMVNNLDIYSGGAIDNVIDVEIVNAPYSNDLAVLSWRLSIDPTTAAFTDAGHLLVAAGVAVNPVGRAVAGSGGSGGNFALSDDGALAAELIQKGSATCPAPSPNPQASRQCLVVSPKGQGQSLSAADVDNCTANGGMLVGPFFDARCDNLGDAVAAMWLPTSLTGGAHYLLLREQSLSGPITFSFVPVNGAILGTPQVVRTCDPGDTWGFAAYMGGANKRLILACSSSAAGDQNFSFSAIDGMSTSAIVSGVAHVDFTLLPARGGVYDIESPSLDARNLAFSTGAGPYSLSLFDTEDFSMAAIDGYQSIHREAGSNAVAYSGAFFNYAGNRALLPNYALETLQSMRPSDLAAVRDALAAEPTRLTYFSQDGGWHVDTPNLFDQAPLKVEGKFPLIVGRPTFNPNGDYAIIAVAYLDAVDAVAALVDTGIDPGAIRVFSIDLSRTAPVINDISPAGGNWSCAKSIWQVGASVNPFSFN